VRPDPEQLRRGEAGHRDVAASLAQAGEVGFQSAALGHGAHVVPQDRRAQHRAGRVQQHRPVHLPGQADPLHGRQRRRMVAMQGVHRVQHRLPPRLGFLLAVARGWALHVERPGSAAHHALLAVHEQRLERGGAEIQA